MKNLSTFLLFLIVTFIMGAQMSCAQRDHIEIPAPLKGKSEILLTRKGYIVSYNVDNKIPNWVAWHLTSEHSEGEYKRTGGYLEDTEVPKPRATKEDYDSTKWSQNLLTNICPQDKSLNSGLWNAIERNCRKWAVEYGDLYIVCGPVLLNREHETIGKNKIVVPEAFFKVILCLNPMPKAIGFVVRNNEGTKKRDQYINTVDEVERITGIDFFPALPDDIENEVEAYANIDDWR